MLIFYYRWNAVCGESRTYGVDLHENSRGLVGYGLPNKYATFDGYSNFIEIENDDSLKPASFTIEAWIKPEAFTDLAGIVSKYHENGTPSYAFRLGIGDKKDHLEFTVNDPLHWTTSENIMVSENGLELDKWQHVAAVYDSASKQMSIYINGEFDSSKIADSGLAQNNSMLAIGMDFGDRYFNGCIDDVRIWNYARSQNEIQNQMDQELLGTEVGLISYWKLDEDGPLFDDYSPNENVGSWRP